MLVVNYNGWFRTKLLYTILFLSFPNCEYFFFFPTLQGFVQNVCLPLFIPLHSFTAGNQIAVNIAMFKGPELKLHFSSVEMAALALSLPFPCLFCIISYKSEQIPALKSTSGLCFIHNIYILITSTVFIFESLSFTAIYLCLETQHALFWGILEY